MVSRDTGRLRTTITTTSADLGFTTPIQRRRSDNRGGGSDGSGNWQLDDDHPDSTTDHEEPELLVVSIGDIALNAAYAAAYSGVGVLLMLISFAVLDVLTPGNLRHQLWADRNRNAGILVPPEPAVGARSSSPRR